MNIVAIAAFGIAVTLCSGSVLAQAQNPAVPPIKFIPKVQNALLGPAPEGLTWQRLEDMQVAVLAPTGWKRHQKDGPYEKVIAFSGQPLDEKGQFETGLTVKLLWHPQGVGNEAKAVHALLGGIAIGVESNKTDNKVLQGTLDERSGKKVMIVRYRNAPAGMTPIIVHTVSIGDPSTGLVYQFMIESPEEKWDETWKVGEQIMSKLFVMFQKG